MQQKQRTRKHFQISPQRHQKELIDCLIKNQSNILHDIQTRFSGYQANQYFDYKSPMTQFLDIQVNNIGDPFSSGTFNINTKQIEIAVLDYYAALFRVTPRNNELDPNAPDKIQNPQAYWGYVLSMGSSEGNLMAFWTARDYIAGKYLIINKLTETKQEVTHTIKKQSPIKIKNYKKNIKEYYCKISKKSIKHHQGDLLQSVYFCSSATHYSVIKSAVIMGVQSFNQVGNQIYAQAQISYKNNNGETIYLKKSGQPFPQFVPVYNDFDGRIDPQKLTALVNFFASKRHGIIIFLNYGTTFTGAFDEIELISQKLEPIFEKYGLNEITREIPDPIQAGKTFQDTRRGYWIHVDGALGNGYLQYLHDYYKNADDQVDNIYGKKYFKSDIPLVNFDKNRSICSTVLSGHKFPGAPWPCGVYMTRHKYQLYPPSSPMYIGSMDSTLSGSRNGLSPVILWYYLSTHSDESISKLSYECFELAKVVQKKIEKIIHDKKQQRKRQILQDPNLPQLNLIVTRAPFAISLVFSQVIDELTQKYTLALQQLADQNDPLVIQTYNHYFLMQSLQRNPKTIEAFLQDLAKPKSFKEQFKTKFVKQQNHQQFFAKVKYSLGHGGW